MMVHTWSTGAISQASQARCNIVLSICLRTILNQKREVHVHSRMVVSVRVWCISGTGGRLSM